MLRKNVLQTKSYAFALRIIKMRQFLCEKNEYILSKQVLRSGTSIGANCREALNAQSKLDFISKLGIALKETEETAYWLELLKDAGYLESSSFESIYSDCVELKKLLVSIIKTTKNNLSKA